MSITWYIKIEKYETSKYRVVSRMINYAELYVRKNTNSLGKGTIGDTTHIRKWG